jgi:hypothetical protein
MSSEKRVSTLPGGLSLTLREGDIFKITGQDGSIALLEYTNYRGGSQIRIKIVADKSIKISNIYRPSDWEKVNNG